MAGTEKGLVRLNKLIASSGRFSRREADRLIKEGYVSVNGVQVTNPALKFSKRDTIFVKGERLIVQKNMYIKFYKPRFMLTSYAAVKGKKSLIEIPFLRDNRLGYSGRLDYESEGLIIFSNDGDFIQSLQRPDKKVEKEYVVMVNKELSKKDENLFMSGLNVQNFHYKPCYIEKIAANKYRVILTEGKKRQIRNMFAFFGSRVERLIRVRIGSVTLDRMKPLDLKNIDEKELKELKRCINYE